MLCRNTFHGKCLSRFHFSREISKEKNMHKKFLLQYIYNLYFRNNILKKDYVLFDNEEICPRNCDICVNNC